MKKPILLVITIFFAVIVLAQEDFISKHGLDTQIDYNISKNQNIRFDSLITVRTDGIMKEIYNSEGKILSVVFQSYLSGQLVNEMRNICDYDNYGNLLTNKIQEWSTLLNEWVDSQRYVYTYDINQNILSETHQNYNSNVWENNFRTNYTHDLDAFISTKTEQSWEQNEWLNQYMSEFLVNDFGDVLSQMRYTWHDGQWNVNVLYSYTYDNNRNNLIYLWQFWRNNTWEDYKITTKTFDENSNELSKHVQHWEDSVWVSEYRLTNTYNNNNKYNTRVKEEYYENWDTTMFLNYCYNTNGWVDSIFTKLYYSGEELTSYSYNENHFIELIIEFKRSSEGIWLNDKMYTYENSEGHISSTFFEWADGDWQLYSNNWDIPVFFEGEEILERLGLNLDLYYSTVSGNNEIPNDFSPFNYTIYPNPFSSHTTIELNHDVSNMQIVIYNSHGMKVKEINNFSGNSIALSRDNLPPGIYYVLFLEGKLYKERTKIIISNN